MQRERGAWMLLLLVGFPALLAANPQNLDEPRVKAGVQVTSRREFGPRVSVNVSRETAVEFSYDYRREQRFGAYGVPATPRADFFGVDFKTTLHEFDKGTVFAAIGGRAGRTAFDAQSVPAPFALPSESGVSLVAGAGVERWVTSYLALRAAGELLAFGSPQGARLLVSAFTPIGR